MRKVLLGLFILLSMFVATPALAGAQSANDAARDAVCDGVNSQLGASCSTSGGTTLSGVVATVLNILSIVAGIAAVVMIIISGMKYITSGGDSSSIASAKSTLIYSIVGLVVVALSQFIVKFVLSEVK